VITTKHDFEVIWRIKLSDDFFYFLKTDIVEDKYQKLSEEYTSEGKTVPNDVLIRRTGVKQ